MPTTKVESQYKTKEVPQHKEGRELTREALLKEIKDSLMQLNTFDEQKNEQNYTSRLKLELKYYENYDSFSLSERREYRTKNKLRVNTNYGNFSPSEKKEYIDSIKQRFKQASKRTKEKVDAELDKAGILLKKLEKRFPNNPDIYLFKTLLADLKEDSKQSKETELDESFDVLAKQMRDVMAKAGVKQVPLDKLDKGSDLGKTVGKLQALGINPEYVVKSPKPNAPTVVLFMQLHYPSRMPTEAQIAKVDKDPQVAKEMWQNALERIKRSQNKIEKDISACVNNGMGNVIYPESVRYGEEVTPPSAQESNKTHFKNMAYLKLYNKFKEKVKFVGYDAHRLKIRMLLYGKGMKYRSMGHNAYIASNFSAIHSKHHKPGNLSYITLGGGHESLARVDHKKNKVFQPDKQHPLPTSHALAYYGFNVVVVNTAFK